MNMRTLNQIRIPIRSILLIFMLSFIGNSTFAQGDCGVTYTTDANSITLSGIDAPHYIVKLFNPDWSLNFQCFDNCDVTEIINDLAPGTYHLGVNTYDESWTPACDFTEDITVSGGGSSGCNTNVTFTTSSSTISVTGLSGAAPNVTYDLSYPGGGTAQSCDNTSNSFNCGDFDAFGLFTAGDYLLTYTLADANGELICTASIVIPLNSGNNGGNDEITLDCPANINIDPTPGNPTIPISWEEPTASTTCASAGLTITQTSGIPNGASGFSPSGAVNIIEYTAEDACGNTKVCSFEINYPQWFASIEYTSCPTEITVQATSANGATVDYAQPEITTDCPDGASNDLGIGLASGSVFPIGTTEVIYQAFGNGVGNGCGVSAVCIFNVTVTELAPEDCNIAVTSSNGAITITGLTNAENTKLFSSDFALEFECNPWSGSPCSDTETIAGLTIGETYYVSAQSSVCDEWIPILVEGGNTDACDNVDYTVGDNSITITGLSSEINVKFFQVGMAFECGPDIGTTCPSSETVTGLNPGFYLLSVYTDDCITNYSIEIPDGGGTLLPDLTLGNFNVPATGGTGTVIQWTADILNNGDIDTDETYKIGWYLSSDNSLSGDDVFVSENEVYGTPLTNQNNGVPFSFTIPSDIAIGNYYLIGKTDNDEVVTESDESNNIVTAPLTITDGFGGTAPCDIDYSISDGTMTISGAGLNSGHVILKLFGPSWNTIFNCSDDCGTSITIPNLEIGTHHLSVNLYDQNWARTCDFLEDVPVGANTNSSAGAIPIDQFRNIILHKLYPSPASDYININMSSLEETNLNVGIYNLMGSLVSQKSIQLNSGINTIQWDIEELPSGFYQILFESGNAHAPIRFVKQRL